MRGKWINYEKGNAEGRQRMEKVTSTDKHNKYVEYTINGLE